MLDLFKTIFGSSARLQQSLIRKRHGTRLLVNEILSLQLFLTALIGCLAIAGLYWGPQWALQANHERWATRWTAELNELGAPLYLPDDRGALLQVERFVQSYTEIDHVTYYWPDGSFLFSVAHESTQQPGQPSNNASTNASTSETAVEPENTNLDLSLTKRLTAKAGTEVPYLFEAESGNRLFRILSPIWTEQMTTDGLYSFDPQETDQNTTLSVVGFVSVDLDFSWYSQQLVANVRIAVVAILALLILTGLTSRVLLRRSLKSLLDLREPILALAQGNLDVQFKPAKHREIAAIVETLEKTAAALAERNARLSVLANQDSLTGLFNRRRFVLELEKEIESVATSDKRSALLFVDFDQFKYVNDACGYLAGDQLLRHIAEELEHCVGNSATVARFGGDEFAVIAPGCTRAQAKTLGSKIVEGMRSLSYAENDIVFYAQCSVGVTMISPDRFSADELVGQADMACRDAKARGRNRMEFYCVSGDETKQMTADIGWVGMIRAALDTDSFVLHYQPIVHVKTGETTHHEVLLRLNTPSDQLVGPDSFLPAATRFGLMAEIDVWVIEHAIAALAEYQLADPDLRFTINLSAAAFENHKLVTLVRSNLAKHKVSAESLIFEITERVAVRQLSRVRSEIEALRELGCEMAIDDFGTGYSSFSHIQKLPVDYIKIDGSFVQDISKNPVDQTMVRVIGEVGRAAGMKTIAEYVGSSAAVQILADLEIDYAQGFFIGEPVATPIRKSLPIPINATPRSRKKTKKSQTVKGT